LPHITVEYSANLEDAADLAGLCEMLRATAAALDVFPMSGVRVRALCCAHYAIADGDPENGFVDISVRLRGGRPLALRRDATERLFTAARSHLSALISSRPIMVSLEMRDIDPELSPKLNTIRERLERKGDHA